MEGTHCTGARVTPWPRDMRAVQITASAVPRSWTSGTPPSRRPQHLPSSPASRQRKLQPLHSLPQRSHLRRARRRLRSRLPRVPSFHRRPPQRLLRSQPHPVGRQHSCPHRPDRRTCPVRRLTLISRSRKPRPTFLRSLVLRAVRLGRRRKAQPSSRAHRSRQSHRPREMPPRWARAQATAHRSRWESCSRQSPASPPPGGARAKPALQDLADFPKGGGQV